jgi:hypothetical protein
LFADRSDFFYVQAKVLENETVEDRSNVHYRLFDALVVFNEERACALQFPGLVEKIKTKDLYA